MSVQITDCTIRDGGYLLNKNSSPAFVKGIIQGLVDAGIDFIYNHFVIVPTADWEKPLRNEL